MTKRKDITLRSRAINSDTITMEEDPVKTKIIRDTFSMPQCDYDLIDKLRKQYLSQGIQMNKGEIVRAGLKVLSNMTPSDLKEVSSSVEKIKTGRPKK